MKKGFSAHHLVIIPKYIKSKKTKIACLVEINVKKDEKKIKIKGGEKKRNFLKKLLLNLQKKLEKEIQNWQIYMEMEIDPFKLFHMNCRNMKKLGANLYKKSSKT